MCWLVGVGAALFLVGYGLSHKSADEFWRLYILSNLKKE
jgi:hypothetical protein